MEKLDLQLRRYAEKYATWLSLPRDSPWLEQAASSVFAEVTALPDSTIREIVDKSSVGIEKRIHEVVAFNAWMEYVNAIEPPAPALVRAQVQSQLYFSFVYLRDRLVVPVRDKLPESSATRAALHALTREPVRHVRNAVAHGEWAYNEDFSGLRFWDRSVEIVLLQCELDAWSTLARGVTCAVLEAVRARGIMPSAARR